MKSLLGLKAKANQAVKERLEQAKAARAASSSNQGSIPKPFDAPQTANHEKTGTESRHEAPGIGPVRGSGHRSRSNSPGKERHPKPSGSGLIDPVIEHLLQKARSEAVKEEFLKQSAAEYTTSHNLKLLAGTYNVNGRLPPQDLDLRPWLDISSNQPDIVAVAFQEIVPLNASNVVMGASLEAASAWDRGIDFALNGQNDRSEGHLVARSQSFMPYEQAGQANAESSGQTMGEESEMPKHLSDETDGAAGVTDPDDLEGYLSPAEDTSSIFSDDHASSLKPFVQMAGKQMVGVYLSIWVKRALLRHIRGVQVTSIGTGIMGYLGNKGAVAARLRVFDSGLTIVAAHLSSGEQEGDELKRNYDYSEIVRRGAFPPDSPSLEHERVASNLPAQQPRPDGKIAGPGRVPGQWGALKGLLDTEHVIWMGDLNYRLAMPDVEARAAIKANRLAEVAEHDELTNMIRQKRAFQGWQEGRLTFPPTFKFRRGTDIYLGDGDAEDDAPEQSGMSVTSTSASVTSGSPNGPGSGRPEGVEKRRTPAWTDRILWRPSERMRQLSYTSSPLYISDHKPVIATFALVAREYLRDRVEAAVDAARRIVDAREMASMPRCELEPVAVDAGTVLYAREKAFHLILSNNGMVKASWQFMPLPGVMFGDAADQISRPAPRWADVSPSQGSLEPGDATEIILRIRIDGGSESTAELLSTTERKLDAILVLRVQEGNDIFCSISGSYSPSFFGLPLPLLNSLSRPLITSAASPAGSSKLQINTQKAAKQRERPGSDGVPADFYSPVSSFNESPNSETGRGGHRRQNASISSEADLEARAAMESAESGEMQSQHSQTAPLPKPSASGLSSVDELIDAFGMTHLTTPSSEIRQPGNAESGQEELHPSSLTRQDSGSIARLVPPELVELTDFLYAPQLSGITMRPGGCGGKLCRWFETVLALYCTATQIFATRASVSASVGMQSNPVMQQQLKSYLLPEKGRLRTAGLFLSSVDLAHAASPRSPSNALRKEEAEAVTTIREALDQGHGVPSTSTAQDVAATILAFFCALPQPFMPHAAAQICDVCPTSKPAIEALLEDALSPAEWAVFRHMTGVIKDALHPKNSEENGLTKASLANLFAEVWFERMPLDFRAASHDLKPSDVADLQRIAEGVVEVAERRSAFVAAFLDAADA